MAQGGNVARTLKDSAGNTLTLTELSSTPHGDGNKTAVASTVVAPLRIVTVSNGVRAIMDDRGTYVIHPAG